MASNFEDEYKALKKIDVLKVSFKYKAVYNLSRLYEVMEEWMNDKGYHDQFHGTDFLEQRFIQEVNGKMKNLFFTLEGTKKIANNIYLRVLNLNSDCIALADTELVQEGHKFKAVKGEITVTLKGHIEYDPKKIWEKAPKMLKSIYGIVRKRWLKEQIDQEMMNYAKEIYEFNDLLKKFVELMSSDNFPAFHPTKRG